MDLKRTVFLNTYINNIRIKEILEYFDECIDKRKLIHVVSLNVDQIMKIEKNAGFRETVNRSELIITDGTPIMWIANFFNKPIVQKLPGQLLTEEVLAHAAKNNYKVFFLGAKEGVAQVASKKMCSKYPGLKIVGTYSPPFGFEKNDNDIKIINQLLSKSKADILVVGLSAPKQEMFVMENREIYNIPISLSVGAAIDFMAGNIKRAPEWINKAGFEWLYRFLKEPRRLFKRYFIDDLKIIKLVFKYKS